MSDTENTEVIKYFKLTPPLLLEFAGSPNPGFLDYNLYLPQGWPVFKPGQEEDSCCFCFLLPQCCQSSPKSKLLTFVFVFGCLLHMVVLFSFEDQNKILFILRALLYANLKENSSGSRRRQQVGTGRDNRKTLDC